jgi:hypothetical protein
MEKNGLISTGFGRGLESEGSERGKDPSSSLNAGECLGQLRYW